jgi:hypothetical protein
MAIPESQLVTWSHQGSIQQSTATHGTVKGVLDSTKSPYHLKSFESFLQGSYGNDTNIYADSDVDIVLRLDSTYYYDPSALPATELAAFNAAFVPASYSFDDFKRDVVGWLASAANFGSAATPGAKAISIAPQGNRRSADVLVAAQYRRYISPTRWHEGVCFFLPNGTRIENFPKQHSQNCTTKHQATKSWFKPTVRVFKNMRNGMIDKGIIRKGLAPSYFIEGLLYNVPNAKFGVSFDNTVVNCFNWIANADHSQLVCANELHWLVRDGSATSWPTADCGLFLSSICNYWNQWGL